MLRTVVLGIFAILYSASMAPQQPAGTPSEFTMRIVTEGLESPWEITWGPDDFLWVTERVGRRIVRVDPEDGSRSTAVEVAGVFQVVGQDGVLGMALHPELMQGTGNDFVYLAYTYDADPGPDTRPANAVRRYTWHQESESLEDPTELIRGLPVHDDHFGGRLAFGPDGKLYLTIGDEGANFARNRCNPNRAQAIPTADEVREGDWSDYQGKILRLNIDGSIPEDNPVIDGVRSHIYSYGHRNPQGLVFAPDGTLYAAEHGPSTDDEVNRIEAGKNYGWPNVAGYPDDQLYSFENWAASAPVPCRELAAGRGGAPASVPVSAESDFDHPDFIPPIQTLFTVPNDYDFQASGAATVAPSGLDIYTSNAIPGWADSLLVTGMTRGILYRLKLSDDGRRVVGEPVGEFKATNRYRDLAIRPDGQAIYLITDDTGGTTNDTGERTSALENPGAILEFVYARQGLR